VTPIIWRTAKNDRLARDWYGRAAWFGNAEAESDIGALYEIGIGGAAPDDHEAMKWFRRAAKDGSPLAAEQMAILDVKVHRTMPGEDEPTPEPLDDASLEKNRAAADLSEGRYQDALAGYQKVLGNNSADPGLRADAADEIGLLYQMGKGGIARNEIASHEAFTQALGSDMEIMEVAPLDPTAIADVAYQLLLVNEPRNALAMANYALVQAPDQIWIEVNKADALMLLGQTDAARAVYLKHKGTDADGQGSTWSADVLGDFATLRSIGVNDPLMAEVAADLAK
jgi:tetratricopeptide (TPR) repeat protein